MSIPDPITWGRLNKFGMTKDGMRLLVELLSNAAYTTDQSENLAALRNTVVYCVRNLLRDVSTSNQSNTAALGSSYTAELTAAKSHALSDVSVVMGGTDITDTA